MHSPKILRHYSIATRISSVVGIILVVMLILAVVEMRGLDGMRQSLDNIVGKHHQRLQTTEDLRFLARHAAVVVRNILLLADPEEKDRELARFEEASNKYNALLENLRNQHDLTEEERSIIDSASRCSEITFNLWRNIVDADYGISRDDAMLILLAEIRNHQWGLLGDLDHLVEVEHRLADESMQEALQNHVRIRSIMILGNVLAIGAGVFFITMITASIVGPLTEIGKKVDKIAGGDLTTRIALEQDDEIGQLAADINHMVEKLHANEAELNEYRYHLEELIELRTGEINEQRERFISVLIHDLKGPLVPIIGFSRLLMKRENLTEEKIARYAEEIYASTMKFSEVIEQTTGSLREKRMSFSFDKEPFDVKELLQSVAVNSLPSLKSEKIDLKINGGTVEEFAGNGSPVMFMGDMAKIRSLMENLLGNAGKYAKFHIEVQLVSIDEQMHLMVDDDGCGVAEPFRKKIFEEYYQVPGSKDGTGVGLYSVKRIVDHYQGKIAVQKSPLGGARFVVILPLG